MIGYDGRRGHPPDRTAPRRGRGRRLRLTDAEQAVLTVAQVCCWGSTASTAGRFAYCRLSDLFHFQPNQPEYHKRQGRRTVGGDTRRGPREPQPVSSRG
jgi:hypothetical protein